MSYASRPFWYLFWTLAAVTSAVGLLGVYRFEELFAGQLVCFALLFIALGGLARCANWQIGGLVGLVVGALSTVLMYSSSGGGAQAGSYLALPAAIAALASLPVLGAMVGWTGSQQRHGGARDYGIDRSRPPGTRWSPAARPAQLPENVASAARELDDLVHELAEEDRPWGAFERRCRSLLSREFGAEANLYCLDQQGQRLRPLGGQACSEAEAIDLPGTIYEHVVSRRQMYFRSGDGEGALLDELAARSRPPCVACFPIRIGPRVESVIGIGRFAEGARVSRERLEVLCRLIELAYGAVSLSQQLCQARGVDQVSGLLSREAFVRAAAEAVAASQNKDEPAALIAVGVEGVRRLDDSNNWAERDEIIRRMVRALEGKIRKDDLAGRFSDDRILVLLGRVNQGLARIIAENVRKALTQAVCEGEGAPGRLIVRCGVVDATNGDDLTKLIQRANACLDEARSAEAWVVSEHERAAAEGSV